MTKKHLFSRLHKWGIANDPATEAERFSEACFVERFGRRRQSRQKQNQCNLRNLRLKYSCLFSLFLCAFLWLKNPRNQRNPRLNISSCLRALRGEKIHEIRVNPWLINDLRLFKGLYNCKETFTDVMSALQIRLFMQNEPNFRKSQMNVSPVKEVVYEERTLGERGKNEPKTNPKRTQTNPISKRLK